MWQRCWQPTPNDDRYHVAVPAKLLGKIPGKYSRGAFPGVMRGFLCAVWKHPQACAQTTAFAQVWA